MNKKELEKLVDEAREEINENIAELITCEILSRLGCHGSAEDLEDHDPALFKSLALGLIKDHCEAELLKMAGVPTGDEAETPEPVAVMAPSSWMGRYKGEIE